MLFNPNNAIVKLCADGMAAEGLGEMAKAKSLFLRAWEESQSDFEKFAAAHFLARRQDSISDKLKWDQTALEMALKVKDENIKGSLPSLYLNIGKCYEDLDEIELARKNYQIADSYLDFLPEDGYGKMIKSGVLAGLERVK
jgi:tetratricopeptide (TPR) repeat protein